MLTDGKYEYTEYTPKKGAGDGVRDKLGDKGELLGFYKRGESKDAYYRIRFAKCGHECFIRVGKNLECNKKDCVSKKMSEKRRIVFNQPEYRKRLKVISQEVQSRPEVRERHRQHFSEYWGKTENRKMQSEKKKVYFSDEDNRRAQSERVTKYFEDEQHRKNLSNAIKVKFKDKEYKQKYLNGRVTVERNKQNPDEVYFMDMLDSKNIEYIWQVPILTEGGKGFVFDFYLPKFDIYVNIDGGVHELEKKKEYDRCLDEYCEIHGIRFCHITVKNLKSSNFNLREVIDK